MLRRRLLLAALSLALGAGPCLADCTPSRGDAWPGLIDVSVTPPRWVVMGDGRVSVADLVVLLQAQRASRTLSYPPPLGFRCPVQPGDLSPGELDESTEPPTWRTAGNAVVDADDVAEAEAWSLGRRQDPPRGLTGTWAGPLTIRVGDAEEQTSAVLRLVEDGPSITGCIVTGGEAEGSPVTGTRDGTELTLLIQDTCNPDPVTLAMDASGDTLVMTSVAGSTCSSDPDGGNVQLVPLVGGTLELSRFDLTGTWMGSPMGTVSGNPQPIRTVLELTSDCPVATGRLSLYGAPALPATATLDGDTLSVVATPPTSPDSDCHLYSLFATFVTTGGTLEAESMAGVLCEPDGAGGHSFLYPIGGGTGALAKGSLTGAWSGLIDVTIDGGTQSLPVRMHLFQSGEQVTGSFASEGGEWSVLRGWTNGRRTHLTMRAQPSPSDDCDQYTVVMDLFYDQGVLAFGGAIGSDCEGDGAGGHAALRSITAAAGMLTRE